MLLDNALNIKIILGNRKFNTQRLSYIVLRAFNTPWHIQPYLPDDVTGGNAEKGQLSPHTLRIVHQWYAHPVDRDVQLLLDALRLAGGAGQPVRQVDVVREEEDALHSVQEGDPGEGHAAHGEGAEAVRLEGVLHGRAVNTCREGSIRLYPCGSYKTKTLPVWHCTSSIW